MYVCVHVHVCACVCACMYVYVRAYVYIIIIYWRRQRTVDMCRTYIYTLESVSVLCALVILSLM